MTNPDREQPRSFSFGDYSFDRSSGRLALHYAFDGLISFCEEFWFPPNPHYDNSVDAAFRALHLAAGVSYFKAFCPPEISLGPYELNSDEAKFWSSFYREGLGEFLFKNRLKPEALASFPASSSCSSDARQQTPPMQPTSLRKPDSKSWSPHALVPIGGGKDSIVTAELLRRSNVPITLLSVNDAVPIRDTSSALGLPRQIIRRIIDPKLIRLNQEGALNGHVPVTGILSFAFVALALMKRVPWIAMSLESSANDPQVTMGDWSINHQYSKSMSFESDLRDYVANYISGDIQYFSLLRPWSELRIARAFAQLTRDTGGNSRAESLRRTFSSCNRNFTLKDSAKPKIWCCQCPKCAFVYAVLAPWIGKAELNQIFGGSPLDDSSLIPLYRSLWGEEGELPFECIGSVNETIAAFSLVSKLSDYQNSVIVKHFLERFPETMDHIAVGFLEANGPSFIPEELRPVLQFE